MAQITQTWEEIIAIANAGTGQDNFSIGDIKELTLTDSTTPVNAQIVGFNHDNLSDGTGKANITFSFQYLYKDIKRMNFSRTNTGSWSATEMRNTTMPLIYNVLPSTIKDNIKQVTKHTGRYNTSTTEAQQTTQDKLWLFSCNEVGLEDYYYNTDETSDNNKIYSYYSPAGDGSAENAKRIKSTAEGENGASWWLRTPNSYSDSLFCGVYGAGYDDNNFASSALGVACGFCIGTGTPPLPPNLIYLTQAQYNAETKNSDTLYVTSDAKNMYLGNDIIANYLSAENYVSIDLVPAEASTNNKLTDKEYVTRALKNKADRTAEYLYFGSSALTQNLSEASASPITIPDGTTKKFMFPYAETAAFYYPAAQKGTCWRLAVNIRSENEEYYPEARFEIVYKNASEDETILASAFFDLYTNPISSSDEFLTTSITFDSDMPNIDVMTEELYLTISASNADIVITGAIDTVYSSIVANVPFSDIVLLDSDVDTTLNTTSDNPISNRAVATAIGNINTVLDSINGEVI